MHNPCPFCKYVKHETSHVCNQDVRNSRFYFTEIAIKHYLSH